ncbi:MAG TPA: GNAT family N-acetyltransferase [Gaiellaceae bacterium]|nr:GNAT family N-acetyltransferase [Gaiellaceae bacterium]
MTAGGVRLRAATTADAAFLRELRNDADVRRHSRASDVVEEDAHLHWLTDTLADPWRHLFVIEDPAGPVGQLRLDVHERYAEVSIAVVASARERGIAAAALRAADTKARELGLSELRAFVRRSNEPSLRLFDRGGYRQLGDAHDLVELRRLLR